MSSNIRVQRICQHCGNEFTAKTTVTKYCGDDCAKRAYKKRKKEEKIITSDQETLTIKAAPVKIIQEQDFLNIKDTCELLGISRMTLHRMIKDGRSQRPSWVDVPSGSNHYKYPQAIRKLTAFNIHLAPIHLFARSPVSSMI